MADESFELLKCLGAGGFATAHKARVLRDDLVSQYGTDIVAVKIPLDEKKERALIREIELSAAIHLRLKELRARNLVRYLGFLSFDGRIVMVMEYVAGGSLRKRLGRIGRQKALPIEQAIQITMGTLAGLDVVHRAHVVHRDIKPENILMKGDTPRLTDLGISRMLASNEMASTTTGTIYYMSPEILSREGGSFVTDIWSLGVVLYEMLTGRLPFGGPDTPLGAMVDLIRASQYTPPSEVRSEISPALEKIIAHMLTKDVGDRYGSAQEVLQDLTRFTSGQDDELAEKLATLGAMAVDLEYDQGDKVVAQLRALAKEHPDDWRIHQQLGELYNRQRLFSRAIQAFKRGLRCNGDNAMLYWDLALAYQQMKNHDKAVACLKKAISLGLDASYRQHAETLLKVLKGH